MGGASLASVHSAHEHVFILGNLRLISLRLRVNVLQSFVIKIKVTTIHLTGLASLWSVRLPKTTPWSVVLGWMEAPMIMGLANMAMEMCHGSKEERLISPTTMTTKGRTVSPSRKA